MSCLAEGVAAGARARGVGVVDREALLLDGVDEVDGGAAEVGRAHPVGDDLDGAELLDDVAVEGAVVEEELVAQAGAATPPQPVAWTRTYGPGKARIFYTSLGAPEDMRVADVRMLLVKLLRVRIDGVAAHKA